MNDREQPTEADSRGAAWMKWMLDTDTCLAIIKRGSGSAIKKLRGKSIGQVGMSAISLGGFLLERLGALAARRLSKRLRSLSSPSRSLPSTVLLPQVMATFAPRLRNAAPRLDHSIH